MRDARAGSPAFRPGGVHSAILCLSALGLALGPWLIEGLGADEGRDPFTFGPKAEELIKPASPVLIGVLWDASHPLAMVGEQTVAVGDRVADWQVVEIRQDGIMIQRGERRTLITPGDAIPGN